MRLLVPRSRYAEAVAALTGAYEVFADTWGHFDEPTCFIDVTSDMRIANDSVYGLSGGINSADFDRAFAIGRRIRIGRAWGIGGIEEYLETKTMSWPA